MSSIPPHPHTPGASSTKNLPGQSCLACRQRKVKCDKQRPCSACSKARLDCVFSDASIVRPRKRKAPDTSLVDRLRRYEDLLKNAGVEFDALESSQGGLDRGSEDRDTETATPDPAREEWRIRSATHPGPMREIKSPGSETGRFIVEEGKTRYLESHMWKSLGNEFRAPKESHLASSEDGRTGTPIQAYSDGNDQYGGDLILGFTPANLQLESLHPPPMHVSGLWQTFMDNVDPLTKFVYTPAVRAAIHERNENGRNVSRGMEALIFAIYSAAVISLSNTECERMFGESKSKLVDRYHASTRKALIMSKFIQSSDLTTLQAFVLFLLSARQHYDHRTLWTLTGISIRISQALGLHRDGASLGVSPFETEMRRRLWWQIIALDGRIAELSGLRISILAHHWDTKVPLNVLDSDLHPDMKESPAERVGPTEMMFCLVRYQIGEFLHHCKSSNNYFLRIGDAATSPSDRDRALDELENNLESRYLRYCDPSLHLHFFTAIVARSAVCGLRLAAHDLRQVSEKAADMPKRDKDALFSNSVKIIEYDNLVQSTRSVRGYLWHIRNHFQWHAFIFMMNELHTRTLGDEVDNAWQRIDEVFEYHPELVTDRTKALHIAIGNLVLKVWAAREASLNAQQHHPYDQTPASSIHQNAFPVQPPAYIIALRNDREKSSSQPGPIRPFAATDGPIGDGHQRQHHLPHHGSGGVSSGDNHRGSIEPYTSIPGMGETADADADVIAPDSYFQQVGDGEGEALLFDAGPLDWEAWDDLLQNYE